MPAAAAAHDDGVELPGRGNAEDIFGYVVILGLELINYRVLGDSGLGQAFRGPLSHRPCA